MPPPLGEACRWVVCGVVLRALSRFNTHTQLFVQFSQQKNRAPSRINVNVHLVIASGTDDWGAAPGLLLAKRVRGAIQLATTRDSKTAAGGSRFCAGHQRHPKCGKAMHECRDVREAIRITHQASEPSMALACTACRVLDYHTTEGVATSMTQHKYIRASSPLWASGTRLMRSKRCTHHVSIVGSHHFIERARY